ncbi:MAG: SUMF1/EgtB/PvdO family nonheme iron enzyme [Planctomycetes bacterium]|nr:SUMF1/EgtB/PvdO family nonheme iron enzyme [Planctomycetota bacterium]
MADEWAGKRFICANCGSTMPVPRTTAPIPLPAQLGDYQIVRQIGSGATGDVYEARQVGLNRRVAIKVLLPHLGKDHDCREGFLKEARAAAALDHPHIVAIHDVGEDKGWLFFSMQFVDGESLGERLRRAGIMHTREALRMVCMVAEALEHAWLYGKIVHQDIKPENIMLTGDGQVKLLDLGLARRTWEGSGVDLRDTVRGTPFYMAPEQCLGRPDVDFRADIYSLGVTLFHALTGRVPFQASSLQAILRCQVECALPDPRSYAPLLSPAVCGLIVRMCAKNPLERYPTYAALLGDLRRLIDQVDEDESGEGGEAAERAAAAIAPVAESDSGPSRFRVLAVVGVLGWLLGLFGLFLVWRHAWPTQPDEVHLRNLYNYAVFYAQSHPDDFDVILRNFREVENLGQETKFGLMAASQREKHQGLKDNQKAIDEFQDRLRALLKQDQFLKASELLLELATRQKPPWLHAKIGAFQEQVEDKARQRGETLLKEAEKLAAAGDFENASDKFEQLKGLGIRSLEVQAEMGITKLEKAQAQAQSEKRSEADALYSRTFQTALQEIRSRRYPQAAELFLTLQENLAYADLKEKVARTLSDIRRVEALFSVAVRALKKQVGKPFTRVDSGMNGILTDVRPDGLILDASGRTLQLSLTSLSAGELAELARSELEARGGEGALSLALFWFYEGKPEKALAAFEKARLLGIDVTAYEYDLSPYLVIESVPPGAIVEMVIEQDSPFRIEVKKNTACSLRVWKEGHEALKEDLTISKGGGYRVTAELKPSDLPASLSLDFEIPHEEKDQHGQPVWKGLEPKTNLPLEIRHRGTGIPLIFIPSGEFVMGNGDVRQYSHTTPAHRVQISQPFYLGKYEITQSEWESIMGYNPSQDENRGANYPVNRAEWRECQKFVRSLNEGLLLQMGKVHFSLPSEAQWEYACRAGTQTEFFYGEDANFQRLGEYAWFGGSSSGASFLHPVGQKKPNPWRIYDICGNASEWCQDVWHQSYEGAPSDGSAWMQPEHPANSYVGRGGGGGYHGRSLRSAERLEGKTVWCGGLRVSLQNVCEDTPAPSAATKE